MEREGATSTIEFYNDNSSKYVIKKNKRNIKSMSIKDQFDLHNKVFQILNNEKYELLYTPKPFVQENNYYVMERIDDSFLLTLDDYDKKIINELKYFYTDLKNINIFPFDFELYLQPNNQVALIDFDKFGKYYDDSFEIIIFHFNKEKHAKKTLLNYYNIPPGFSF